MHFSTVNGCALSKVLKLASGILLRVIMIAVDCHLLKGCGATRSDKKL